MGGGKKQIVTGYTYNGSYAAYLGIGPAKRLLQITNGDTVIWEGPIEISSANVNGYTVLNTSIGEIRFYWGSRTQNVDSLLDSLQIDRGAGPVAVPMPAFRGLIYFVCNDVAFGEQVTPPTLSFLYEVATSGLTLTAHSVDGDAVIPEAIYQFMTDTLAGAGVLPGDIDAASFAAAAEQTIDEGLAASPEMDSVQQCREWIGTMLSYIDGVIYWNGGKFVMKLNRAEDPTGLTVLSEAHLAEEPRPAPEQFENTWSRTIVNFHDRTNKWEETGADYNDPANSAIKGHKVTKAFNYPWFTRRDPAQLMAAFLGLKGGVPAGFWELTLLPSNHTLTVGQLVKLNYAKLGIVNRIVRIKSKRRGPPSNPGVTIEVFEEPQRDIANNFIPGLDDNNTIPGNTADFELVDTTPRLSWVPPDLKEGAADGFLIAMNRPATGEATGGEVHWTYSPVDQPYQLLATFGSFPAKAQVIRWHKIRTASFLLRVSMDTPYDYTWLQGLKDLNPEIFVVCGVREWVTSPAKNEHQPLSPWMRVVAGGVFDLISPTVIDVEVEATGWYGTDGIAYETEIDEGRFPTVHCYFGRVEDFAIYPTDVLNFERNAGNAIGDAALLRYLKTPLFNTTSSQGVADVAATTYDRNDLTMSDVGTLSREWGAAVKPTDEDFDVEGGLRAFLNSQGADYLGLGLDEIDDALGAVFDGTATADQTLLVASIDDVLGAMASSNQVVYHP